MFLAIPILRKISQNGITLLSELYIANQSDGIPMAPIKMNNDQATGSLPMAISRSAKAAQIDANNPKTPVAILM